MKQNNFGRKKRQLKVLAEKLQHLVRYHRMEAGAQIEKLIQKIKILVEELTGVLSQAVLKKILGVAAVLIGISFSNKVNAQEFKSPVPNPFGLESTDTLALPAFADLDGDGDQDLLVGERSGDFKYFQNIGTILNPQFAAPLLNPFGLVPTLYFASPAFADLDNDGDLDLLAGQYYGALHYFQNTGTALTPKFELPLENPFGIVSTYYYSFPAFVDLDGDSDLDLIVGEGYGTLKYFQNTGSISKPLFAPPLENPFDLVSTYNVACPAFVDLDNDGDMDLLVGEYDGSMQYFENTGSASAPQFTSPLSNPFGLVSTYGFAFPAFADLDSDSDLDLLVGEVFGAMQYFENDTTIGIADLSQTFNLTLFPNPVDNILHVESEEEINKIEIFNSVGENVITVENKVSQVALQHLSPGTYLVKVTSALDHFTTAKIQKQ